MTRMIEHDDRIRVRVGLHPTKDELVLNLYKYVGDKTFVYDANRGRWQFVEAFAQHEPSFVFQGRTGGKVREAFQELDQTNAAVRVELLNANDQLAAQLRQAQADLAEGKAEKRTLLQVASDLAAANRYSR